jgi:PAS domain S-box-containing protein
MNPERIHPQLRAALRALLIVGGYYAAGVISLGMQLSSPGISFGCLPNAVLLAGLLLTPPRTWWLTLLVLVPAHLHLSAHFQAGVPLVVTFVQFAANTTQAVLAAALLLLHLRGAPRLYEPQHMTAFIGIAAIGAPALVSVVAAKLIVATGWMSDYWFAWRTRLMTQAVGVISLTPLLLLTFGGGRLFRRPLRPARLIEISILLGALLAVGIPLFASDLGEPGRYPALLYLPLPLLLWAALRFELRGLCLSLFVVAVLSVGSSRTGHGPFVHSSPEQNLLSLQLFQMAISLPLMFLAALVEERRRAGVEAVREKQERLRAALAASETGTFRWDVATNHFDADDSLRRLTGLSYKTGPHLLDAFLSRVHSDDRARVLAGCVKAATHAADFEQHFRVTDETGRVRCIEAKGRTVLGAGGQPAYVTGACIDVTARRQHAIEFRALAESVPHHIWMVRRNGTVDYVNDQWFDYTGAERGSESSAWAAFVHPDDRERTLACWSRAVETGEPYAAEFRYRRRDGSYRWFLSRAVPVRDDALGLRWFGAATDIDDQKKAEEALRDADRRKDEFLAVLGHELRNPLAPIVTAVEIMRRLSPTDERVPEARDLIARQAARMTRLLDDLLDVSRITRGKIRLQLEALDIATVVAQAIETSRPLLEARRHELAVSLPHSPLWIRGDAVRLPQVISNLLDNAAKYTESRGRIELVVEARGTEIVLTVRDTGIGIPPAMLGHVFELFTQGEHAGDVMRDGLGIGLTVVRSLVEMHGGGVEARSAGIGKGSEFIVRLPAVTEAPRRAYKSDRGSTGEVAVAPLRILVVDDNRDVAKSLSRLLAICEHDVRVANDGASALDEIRTFAPDMVLLDLSMPGVGGLEVARRVRQDERTSHRRTRLVAMTGFGQEQDRRSTAAAGFDDHLVKPVDPDTLQSLLNAAALERGALRRESSPLAELAI